VDKKNARLNPLPRAAGRRPGRFSLLPARGEVITSARVKHLLEISEFTPPRQPERTAETIRSLRESRIVLDDDLSDIVGDGRD
jgi:hypothetical protein